MRASGPGASCQSGTTRGPQHSGSPNLDFNITDYRNQAISAVWQGKTKEIEDNLGICVYVGTWSGAHFLIPANYAELVNTGLGLNLNDAELMDHYAVIGRNLEKAFNSLHTNLTRDDDLPPKRFRVEAVRSGPYKGLRADEEKYHEMLDEYYRRWGWEKTTGRLTRSALEKLGLDNVAKKLAAQGELAEI